MFCNGYNNVQVRSGSLGSIIYWTSWIFGSLIQDYRIRIKKKYFPIHNTGLKKEVYKRNEVGWEGGKPKAVVSDRGDRNLFALQIFHTFLFPLSAQNLYAISWTIGNAQEPSPFIFLPYKLPTLLGTGSELSSRQKASKKKSAKSKPFLSGISAVCIVVPIYRHRINYFLNYCSFFDLFFSTSLTYLL